MIKISSIIKSMALAVLLAATLSGCAHTGMALADDSTRNTNAPQTARFNIVTTIFPPYDWVREIIGSKACNFNLTFLTNSGVDLHSYQPSVRDIALIAASDMFIYIGGHSDFWVVDAISGSDDIIALNLMEVLGKSASQRHYHHHNCDDPDCHHEPHDDDNDDEHVWLSLPFAKTLVTAIADALSQLDPANAHYYYANLNAYISQLNALHEEYKTATRNATRDTLLFADRFPFRHLLQDYGLAHYAAFPGCHAETEASFATIAFLIGRVNELDLRHILVTETSDKALAATISRDSATRPQVLVLDSMQSVTTQNVQNGMTYISTMRNNLNILKEALN